VFSETRTTIEYSLAFQSGFLRIGGSEHSLDVGRWWLREVPKTVAAPLADRVEIAVVQYLLTEKSHRFLNLDQAICTAFPGLLTPSRELVEAILHSYARQNKQGLWSMREDDLPKARRTDLEDIRVLLKSLGQRLGYMGEDGEPLVWKTDIHTAYYFYLSASAVLGKIIFEARTKPDNSFIVLPGGRSGLVMYKLTADARLRTEIEKGWRFLKFRQLRQMSENQSLTQESFKEQLGLDPLSEDETQIPLL